MGGFDPRQYVGVDLDRSTILVINSPEECCIGRSSVNLRKRREVLLQEGFLERRLGGDAALIASTHKYRFTQCGMAHDYPASSPEIKYKTDALGRGVDICLNKRGNPSSRRIPWRGRSVRDAAFLTPTPKYRDIQCGMAHDCPKSVCSPVRLYRTSAFSRGVDACLPKK
jgi:hypothetical protein